MALDIKSHGAEISPDLNQFDWGAIHAALDAKGHAVLPGLLDRRQCGDLAAMFDDDAQFRSHIHMARHSFGRGEYKYLKHPLPPLIAELRAQLYRRLAPIANAWCSRLSNDRVYPDALPAFIAQCHAAGQQRPTPLLLRYRKGDYNCLHQDLYGEFAFPLQIIIMLCDPGRDFTGGELMLVENRPRMQSIGHVVRLQRGDAAIIAVNQRPVRGARGDYRVTMRHGVSEIVSGQRNSLGIILHDAH